jgi:hypothetical protein
LVTGGKPKGIVLLQKESSVVNSGLARGEKGADSSLLVTGISSLVETGRKLEGIVLSRVSSSVANVAFARVEESDRRPMGSVLVNGELPVTLTRPDTSVILLQKTPISIFVRSFYRSLIARFNRQGGPYPLVH